METVTPEKFLGLILRTVGQQRDPKKIFLTRELDRVVEQFGTITVSLKLFMNYQVFQQDHKTAFRGADREKQIDHADDRAITAKHEHAPAARLFENQAQTAQLFVFVRAKIALLRKESAEHLGQLVQISLGSRLNDDFLAHRLHCLFQKLSVLATRD